MLIVVVVVIVGNARAHHSALAQILDMNCVGEASLQNSLDLAAATLRLHSFIHNNTIQCDYANNNNNNCRNMPAHSSRECIYVVASLSTCDPGDVFNSIQVCMRQLILLGILFTKLFQLYLENANIENPLFSCVTDCRSARVQTIG